MSFTSKLHEEHNECPHDIHYCEDCDEVYCVDCEKTWSITKLCTLFHFSNPTYIPCNRQHMDYWTGIDAGGTSTVSNPPVTITPTYPSVSDVPVIVNNDPIINTEHIHLLDASFGGDTVKNFNVHPC